MDWLIGQAAKKRVFVLPAFETAKVEDLKAAYAIAGRAAAADKQELEGMEQDHLVNQFALYRYKTVSQWEGLGGRRVSCNSTQYLATDIGAAWEVSSMFYGEA